MPQRLSPLFIPELALSCWNSDPVLGRVGQVVNKIKCVMLFFQNSSAALSPREPAQACLSNIFS